MLGRLARWLRILGCDVEYLPSIEDAELVAMAQRTGRLILTRDTLLVRRRWARDNHFLVYGDHFRDQLRQVVGEFRIDPRAGFLSRCLECNTPLAVIDREEAAARVPEYVYGTQAEFRACPRCSKVYWAGTHRERMIAEITAMLNQGAAGNPYP